jgi:hypothetical protein
MEILCDLDNIREARPSIPLIFRETYAYHSLRQLSRTAVVEKAIWGLSGKWVGALQN